MGSDDGPAIEGRDVAWPPIQVALDGGPVRRMPAPGTVAWLVGVDVAAKVIGGVDHIVVQLLLDDDAPGFDRDLLDTPLVAEIVGPDGQLLERELFDHDRFRRRLAAERSAGESVARGVLIHDPDGELPPRWARFAFLPLPLASTAGATLSISRTTVEDLVRGLRAAAAAGEIDDAALADALTSLEHRHPAD